MRGSHLHGDSRTPDSRACGTEGLCTPSLTAAIPWQLPPHQGGAVPGQGPLFLLPAVPRGTGQGREGATVPFLSSRKANRSGKLRAINLRLELRQESWYLQRWGGVGTCCALRCGEVKQSHGAQSQ